MIKKALTSNESVDWTSGVIRSTFQDTWPLFLTLHLLVGVVGLIASIYILFVVIYNKLHKNNTGSYLINIIVNNMLILTMQLPINFLVGLYENWTFGVAMCYMSAVVPYILVHSSMLTFIIMSIDRYRSISHPGKRQLNVLVCLITIWISSICAAMPIVTYIHYRDIHYLNPRVRNNGLCWSTGDDYTNIVFVTIFTLPAVVIALILVKTSAELKTKEELCKLHAQLHKTKKDTITDISVDVNSLTGEDVSEKYKDKQWIEKEKKTQKYLTAMTCLWVVFWFPMKIFGIVTTNTVETVQNAEMFDVAQMILLPLSTLSTITTPICMLLLKRSLHKAKDRPYKQVKDDGYDTESVMCYNDFVTKMQEEYQQKEVTSMVHSWRQDI